MTRSTHHSSFSTGLTRHRFQLLRLSSFTLLFRNPRTDPSSCLLRSTLRQALRNLSRFGFKLAFSEAHLQIFNLSAITPLWPDTHTVFNHQELSIGRQQ